MDLFAKPTLLKNDDASVTQWHMPILYEKNQEAIRLKADQEKSIYENEIAQLKENAYQEAFQAGKNAGFETGKEEVEKIVARLSALEKECAAPYAQITQTALATIKTIVVNLTKSIILQEIKTDPAIIENILQEIMESLTEVTNNTIISCAKEDKEVVTRFFEQQLQKTILVKEQENSVAGSFIVSTENSHLDATLETRIAQLVDRHFLA